MFTILGYKCRISFYVNHFLFKNITILVAVISSDELEIRGSHLKYSLSHSRNLVRVTDTHYYMNVLIHCALDF